jgi:hypothetical protein
MFSGVTPPSLPLPPVAYDASYINRLLQVLRIYFNGINAVQNISVGRLNLDLNTLPTEADIATLRAGDVYRDSTAANVLKVKT